MAKILWRHKVTTQRIQGDLHFTFDQQECEVNNPQGDNLARTNPEWPDKIVPKI